MVYKLTVEKREKSGTKVCRELREGGNLPGVVYGEGKEAEAITLKAKDFEKVWRDAGETAIIALEGLSGAPKSVLVQDVMFDPLYDTPVHVDFYTVRTDKPVEVKVPLTFDGVAPAVKELGGNLVKVLHELSIEALPNDLPQEISVTISLLKTFEDQIKAKDILLPKGVTLVQDGEDVVALVQETREEAEPETAIDISSIAVEKKGKEEEVE